MSRFRVTSMDGDKSGSYDNRAIEIDRNDPVQLSAYGLYTKRDSVTTPPTVLQSAGDQPRKNSNASRDAPRKISLGIAQWTRWVLALFFVLFCSPFSLSLGLFTARRIWWLLLLLLFLLVVMSVCGVLSVWEPFSAFIPARREQSRVCY